MIVRNATVKDSHQLLRLIELKASFDRSMKGFSGEVSTTPEKIERTLFGEHPFAFALLLEAKKNILGFALYHFRYSSFSGEPSIWLDDLLILEGERSKGCGAKLMSALENEAQKAQASHIAWTASPLNKRAHQFYSNLGANVDRMDGNRPFFRLDING
ncbi:GNAT family N-acetyltransferase [Vibrio sp. 10N.261.55.A7]|uniref:GNAT family N-acetyltransferase n=1 Tax=Vibrio sp. 10N.261.55.A7 TaxID=1880851 RepID=UPI000CC7028E|nr:GNAT family N-acetyltransferase [Vibrio sp. 10N.261.55.A7]PMJ98911.1 GNAT family N-acetyltransferase [Vibrio sp. 10N.261.55.A7]